MIQSNLLSIQSMLSTSFTEVSKGNTFVGIDFGTSTTVVSIASQEQDGVKIKTLPIKLTQILEDGTIYQSEKLPSVIAWYNGKLLVGEGASNLKYTLTKGKNIWFSFKMEIGEDLGAKYYNSEVGDVEGIKIRNPKDCVRVFFMYLRMLITKYCKDNGLSENIHYAVSIPASFEANQRKELMEALETNGMTISKQSLIDEPNAAFISYVHDSEDSEKPLLISPHYNSKVLVFDFGGGTCDISILEIGKSATGLYSKNIAISKFTKLGGDDVDRYLTYKYIMPRFFEYNHVKPEDFRTKEKQYIATQLYKVAERLKILMCRRIANQMYQLEIPLHYKNSTECETISVPVMIETMKGNLSQNNFILTAKELADTMQVFSKKSRIATQIKGQEDYNNIFMPINSAIEKADIEREEIDYVLLIGGSAQNPFIQEALKKEFVDSQILVPQDLQTHVSKGAAIHSLLMNGMNKCIIQPITSEPILVITKDVHPRVILPAGSTIPSDTVLINDLVTSRDNQDVIELPICVGSTNKMLFNLKIELQGGVPINTPVQIVLEVNADKLLLVQASCMGIICRVEPKNPFANKELTTEERIVLVAERQANLEAEQNHGTPTKNGLIKLRQAYEKAGNSFRAAETLELQTELYPSPDNYGKIAVLYWNSGNEEKAIEYNERAYQYNPNSSTVNFNLGHSLMRKDPQRARQLINKAYEMNPADGATMITLARMERQAGNRERAKDLEEQAYDMLLRKWKAETLASHEYSWLSSLASDLAHYDIARQVRQSQPGLETEKYYDGENLTRTRSNALDKL
ncbi:MAG: Hsp70 family protein [Bacteroidaceae bacterium]|nr:Hsp70 family protein [Prevotellaceae bacterium]MDY5760676.1 Hsp70 family protein [Bacteroidaceae bacterium]